MAETPGEEFNDGPRAETAEGEKKPQEAASEENENSPEEESSAEGAEQESAEEAEKKEEEDFKAKYYYLAAEMQNLRKRFDKEKQNLIKYGNEKVLSELIEVIDNLDRTLSAIKNDEDDRVKNIVSGIEMVRKQFLDVLDKNGVKPIEALGEKFDPNFHDAMSQQKDEEKEDETIINVYQKGYMLNDRLLRPAKVVVVKNTED